MRDNCNEDAKARHNTKLRLDEEDHLANLEGADERDRQSALPQLPSLPLLLRIGSPRHRGLC